MYLKGSWSIWKQLFYRIQLAGSWCLAVVDLVNAYSSILISNLTIPTLKPITKSFDDITFRNVQGLKPIVEKNNIAMISASQYFKNSHKLFVNKLVVHIVIYDLIESKHCNYQDTKASCLILQIFQRAPGKNLYNSSTKIYIKIHQQQNNAKNDIIRYLKCIQK